MVQWDRKAHPAPLARVVLRESVDLVDLLVPRVTVDLRVKMVIVQLSK